MDPELSRQIAELAGRFGLIGAAIGALAGLLGASIGAWNQRVITRETEFRHWRLNQLRPTIDMVNKSFVHLQDIDRRYRRLQRSGSTDDLEEFQREIGLEFGPVADFGYMIVVARPGANAISKSLKQFMNAYLACIEEVNTAIAKSLAAHLANRD